MAGYKAAAISAQFEVEDLKKGVAELAHQTHTYYHQNSFMKSRVAGSWRKCTLATCRNAQKVLKIGAFKQTD